jgi:hypothetical protein
VEELHHIKGIVTKAASKTANKKLAWTGPRPGVTVPGRVNPLPVETPPGQISEQGKKINSYFN